MQNQFEPLSAQPKSSVPALPPLEEYLDRFCAPLADHATDEQRLAIREEIRTHILGLVAAYEELGSTPAEALQAALRQFGEADQIGRSLSREYPSSFTTGPLMWALLHGVLGGAVGALVFLNSESIFQQLHFTSSIDIAFDCLAGLALGWMPGLYLLKRPMSPLRAAIQTGAFYSLLTTGLCAIIDLQSAMHTFSAHPLYTLLVIATVGINGALGGGAMAGLFQRLKRFAPRSASKSLIAR